MEQSNNECGSIKTEPHSIMIDVSSILDNLNSVILHLVGDTDYISGYRDALNEIKFLIEKEQERR